MTKKASMDIEKTILHKEKESKSRICFPTGSDLMDIQVGGGVTKGYPAGRIINIVGDKSSGKTFMAIEVIVAAYYKYGYTMIANPVFLLIPKNYTAWK